MATMRWLIGPVLLCVMPMLCSAQQTAAPQRLTLGNGLTVILEVNHKTDKVAIETFHRAGFQHEPQGKAHLAHVAEHMVCYCATASYGPRQGQMLLQQKGGMANAETLATFVHYDYTVPASELKLALQVAAERIGSIVFADNVLREEVPRVVQEMDFVQNNPQAGLLKFGLIGLSHVLRFGDAFVPVYAGPSKLTAADIEAFVKTHYRPCESILVVVGDFDPVNAQQLINIYFGSLPRSEPPPKTPVTITTDVDAKWDLRSDAIYLVYPKADPDEATRMALTLFGNYLQQSVWNDPGLKGMTKSRFCSNQLYPVGDLPFFVFAEAKQGVSLDSVEARLKQIVTGALTDFNPGTFAQIKMGLVYFLQSSVVQSGYAPPDVPFERMLGQEAINLGIKEILRDGAPPNEFLARLNALDYGTANQIIRSVLSPANEKKVRFRSDKR
ncbi:MAG: insulinase family protein [Planctomycetes bacterium]|nr:insulinase family protein [Planctomycetota bacterium]